jgi:multiple antibiotic resistance protein
MDSIFELFQAIGLGLVLLLPLANPLTTVALLLGLSGNMTSEERNQQSKMASIYVFFIMTIAYYAGQVVMNTFGIYWFSYAFSTPIGGRYTIRSQISGFKAA